MTDALEEKLQILINLQARALTSNIEKQIDKVSFLSDCGISNKDIAEILNTTPGYVSVAKAKIKKAKGSASE
jgi:transcriptional regulator